MLFGFDLLGRPPIQLPDSAPNALLFRRHHSGSGTTPTTTLTTQTFDSFAAPLHISTIQEISVSKATEAAEAEAKRLKEKEEMRQRRKAMKRLVEAGAVGDGEQFEGFQGSGGLADYGYLFVGVTSLSFAISIPAIQRRLCALCISSSSSSGGRRRRGRFGRKPVRAQKVKEWHSLEWRSLGFAS